MDKLITLRVSDENAQILLFKRKTEKIRYNILMEAEIVSMVDDTPHPVD